MSAATAKAVFAKLRPPCARNSTLLYPYAQEGLVNLGYTLRLPSGEPAVAPGDGVVVGIVNAQPSWKASQPKRTNEVTIDHGLGVSTVVGGLGEVSVHTGMSISRGTRLGLPVSDEVFLGVYFNGSAMNPVVVSRHFRTLSENWVPGQGGKLRFAPDRVTRTTNEGILSTVVSGVRYFVNALVGTPNYLLSIDFNGSGAKTGLAAAGFTGTDFWNVYAPTAFTETVDASCHFSAYAGRAFSATPFQWLHDYRGAKTSVRLEKVAPLSTDAGSHASFDSMLATYVGGYDMFSVPITNEFNLKGIPPATYTLFLYADTTSGPNATDFYVSVNAGAPTVLTNAPTGAGTFVENDNYVKVNLVLSSDDVVAVKANGFLSGLQLKRV